MFVTPAFAQATTSAASPDMLISILPFVLIFVIMYFLLIRPQRQQAKRREEMLKNVRRGDVIVSGGIVGKVTKAVDDNEVEVEIAEGVRVRVVRALISEVRVKGEPVADNKK